jgi:hypothetical protein
LWKFWVVILQVVVILGGDIAISGNFGAFWVVILQLWVVILQISPKLGGDVQSLVVILQLPLILVSIRRLGSVHASN